MPSSAEAMLRTSSTRHWSPTPRQSHWKTPTQDWTAACRDAAVSPSFTPSVSRMACRLVTCGTVSKIRFASRNHVPIAVPPLARRPSTARTASARVLADMAASGPWRPVG